MHASTMCVSVNNRKYRDRNIYLLATRIDRYLTFGWVARVTHFLIAFSCDFTTTPMRRSNLCYSCNKYCSWIAQNKSDFVDRYNECPNISCIFVTRTETSTETQISCSEVHISACLDYYLFLLLSPFRLSNYSVFRLHFYLTQYFSKPYSECFVRNSPTHKMSLKKYIST